ncbi:MAG: hypothetical protein WAW11_01875 [Patescibacteria group bacterium]
MMNGLEKFKIKMEFSLELLHQVIGNEDSESVAEIIQRAKTSEVFSEEELTKIQKKITEAFSVTQEDEKIDKISSLKEYLFHLLD